MNTITTSKYSIKPLCFRHEFDRHIFLPERFRRKVPRLVADAGRRVPLAGVAPRLLGHRMLGLRRLRPLPQTDFCGVITAHNASSRQQNRKIDQALAIDYPVDVIRSIIYAYSLRPYNVLRQ